MSGNNSQEKGRQPERIRLSPFREGARIIVQECRKCRIKTESDHLLVMCPRRDIDCGGGMTGELDFFFVGEEKQVS